MQKSHHSQWFSRPGRRKPLDTERHHLHSLVAGHQRELEEKGGNDYKTRTECHRIVCWNKLADWTGTLQKGAYVEIEGELRYRDYTPAEADWSVRVAEIHARSILALDRSDRQPVSATESKPGDTNPSTERLAGSDFMIAARSLLHGEHLAGTEKSTLAADAENAFICRQPSHT